MNLKQSVLNYVDSNRIKSGPYGQYVYRNCDTKPLLYCSAYAAMTYDLFGELDNLDNSIKKEWVDYIMSYQCDDGLFRDPAFGLPDDLSNVPLNADSGWYGGKAGWGWWHLTNHVYSALTSLGVVAKKPLKLLKDFYSEKIVIEKWLEERDWNKAWSVGNEVLNLGTFLLYARDFHDEPKAESLVERLFDYLDKIQDDTTGYWGNDCYSGNKAKLQAMCGAYHEYILYYYEQREIKKNEKIIDATLSLQNDSGGFALDGTGGACEDIDAAFILINSYLRSSYKRAEINAALKKILPEILSHQNPDGGFVYLRGKPYMYGTRLMYSDSDQSCMFPTWFRALSLAVIAKVLKDEEIGKIEWKFNKCPYIQWFDSILLV